MAVSRVADWVEGGELPADDYQLAGFARFHPRSNELLAALGKLTVECQPFISHWQPQVVAKALAVQRRLESATQTFVAPTRQQAYDEWLVSQIREAYAREFQRSGSTATPDIVRRWLRLVQHVHASRIEPMTLRLMRAEREVLEPVVIAQPPAPTRTDVAESIPSAMTRAPDSSDASLAKQASVSSVAPNGTNEPDDFGLVWIVGSAIVTAVICLTLLLLLFGERIGARGRSLEPVAQKPADDNSALLRAEPLRKTQPVPEPPGKTPPAEPMAESSTEDLSESTHAPPPVASPADDSIPTPTPTPPPSTPSPSPTPTQTQPTRASPTPASAAPSDSMPTSLSNGGHPKLAFGRSVHTLAWDASGKQLAVGGDGDEIVLWLVCSNTVSRLTDAFAGCTALAFSPNGRMLAAATTDGPVFVWNTSTWKPEKSIRHSDLVDVRSLAWLESNADPQIAVGDADGYVRIFSSSQGNLLSALEHAAKCGSTQALAVPSRSRPLVVSAHLDGTVVLWNVGGSRSILRCLSPHGGAIVATLAEPAAAASKGAEVTLCDHPVCYGISVSRDEKLLAVAARDLELWELDASRFLVRKRFLPGNDAAAYRLAALSSKSDLLAAADSAGTVSIVDVSSWTVLNQEKQPAAVLAIAWHPTEAKLAVGRDDGTVVVVPVIGAMLAQRAEPDFDPAKLLSTAQSLVTDENWYDCSRLVSVVSAFRVPQAEKPNLDRLRLAARNGMQVLVSAIRPESVTFDELDEATHQLQLAIDLDSAGPLGKQARDLMRQLPARTPAAMAKAEKAAAASAGAAAAKKKGRRP